MWYGKCSPYQHDINIEKRSLKKNPSHILCAGSESMKAKWEFSTSYRASLRMRILKIRFPTHDWKTFFASFFYAVGKARMRKSSREHSKAIFLIGYSFSVDREKSNGKHWIRNSLLQHFYSFPSLLFFRRQLSYQIRVYLMRERKSFMFAENWKWKIYIYKHGKNKFMQSWSASL